MRLSWINREVGVVVDHVVVEVLDKEAVLAKVEVAEKPGDQEIVESLLL